MKNLFAFFSLLLFLSINLPLYSQEKSDTSKVDIFNKFSLQFQVRLLELNSFQGGLISLKYHFNDHLAFRTGISMSFDNSDSEDAKELSSADSTIFSIKSKKDNVSISLPAQFLYYINPHKEIKVFLGLGPFITYSVGKEKNTDYSYSNNYSGSFLIESKSEYHSIGLSSAYGVEWFFTDNMSLTGEYGFTFSYYYMEACLDRMRIYPDSDNYIEKDSRKIDGWRFSSSGVRFGLSIYL